MWSFQVDARMLATAGRQISQPRDARRLAIAPDQPVKVSSRRGAVIARAFVTTRVRPGEVFVPMHFPETNRLTVAAFDPHSRQPAYKASAVNVEAVQAGEAPVV